MGRLKITIEEDVRTLKKGDVFEFDKFPTLIVGKNGCGKSTLFHALRGTKNDLKDRSLSASDYRILSSDISVEHDYEKIFHYDSVKDSGSDMMNAYDAMGYIDAGGFASRNSSHGETQLIQFDIFMKKIEGLIVPGKTLLTLDEMDKGFGLWFASKYYAMIKHLAQKHQVDIIAITHNPIAMMDAEEVYWFNQKRYMTPKLYIGIETGIDITMKRL